MAKVDRKRLLDQKDDFITFSEKAAKWCQENTKLLIFAVAVVIVGLSAILGVRAYLDYRRESAARAMGGVFASYALHIGDSGSARVRLAAQEGLSQIAKQYGRTPAGIQARFALGNLLLGQSEFNKAVAIFSELCEEPELPPALAPMAWRSMGYAHEGKGKYAGAAQSYERAMKGAGPALKIALLLDLARALTAADRKNAAGDIYQRILAQSPDDQTADAAKAGLASLGLDAPQGSVYSPAVPANPGKK